MLAVTTNDITGWEIQRVCGEVFGLTVRSRNAFSQAGAGFKSMLGGELKGMTKSLIDSRNEVMNRMFEEARVRGGNAVIAMRFDTSEMGPNWTEICAYGTAVVAIPVSDAAKQTAAALGYGQPAPQNGPPPTGPALPGVPVRARPGGLPIGSGSAGRLPAAGLRPPPARPARAGTTPTCGSLNPVLAVTATDHRTVQQIESEHAREHGAGIPDREGLDGRGAGAQSGQVAGPDPARGGELPHLGPTDRARTHRRPGVDQGCRRPGAG